MRTLIMLGHPRRESLCGALAEAYAAGAKEAGSEVRHLNLGDLAFDPLLRHGYAATQPLEPDLQAAQEALLWAEHLVIVYPVWWGSMPALLKGFFDRALMPGFGFRYRDKGLRWDRLLTGRSAHLLVTMDAPPWYHRWLQRWVAIRQVKTNILAFCGIKPTGVTTFGSVKLASSEQRERWLSKAQTLGRLALQRKT